MNRFCLILLVLLSVFITACDRKLLQNQQRGLLEPLLLQSEQSPNAPLQIEPEQIEPVELQTMENTLSKESDTSKIMVDTTSKEKNETKNIVDLTILSSIMVYSEVYTMMTTPEEYDGKTVKMTGMFSIYHDDIQDTYYLACLIPDAMACCQQGLEFVLADDCKYLGNYPDDGTEITVTGIFKSYEECGYNYCHLVNAKMEINQLNN